MSRVKSKEKKETKPDECVGCWNTVHYREEKKRMKTNANNHKESFKHQPAVRSDCVFSYVCVFVILRGRLNVTGSLFALRDAVKLLTVR